MRRSYAIFLLAAAGVFLIDQSLKELFVSGFYWESDCLTLGFTLNRGVAFSMLEFLGGWLKWILAILIAAGTLYAFAKGYIKTHPLLLGTLLGAAGGNLWDRFLHGGVVDYVYWHCGFEFAVFNFADVMIDVSVVGLLVASFKKK